MRTARKGNQTPTFEQHAPWSYTDSEQAAMLASEYFGEPLEWQRHVLDVLMSRTETDTYANSVVCVPVPRQNGKSWDVRARCFYGAVVDGEKILYTCQHGDTADEMFKALSEPFEADDGDPELLGMLKAVRKTNGQQSILLNNGGLIRFTTRTNSLARGKSYDVIVYDEAQELTSAQQEASLPTVSASAKHNPQVIYLCTPPSSESAGDVIQKMHDEVHKGLKPDVAWLEWGIAELGDVTDVDRWYEVNPSLGYLIDERTVVMESSAQTADGFARERLGWWGSGEAFDAAIPQADWKACEMEAPTADGFLSYGVKLHGNRDLAALSVCVRGDVPHVELIDIVDTSRGMGELADWLDARRSTLVGVAIDGRSGADALVDALRERKFPMKAVLTAKPSDAIASASMFRDAVLGKQLTHIASPALDDSAVGSTRRKIGTAGGWGFGDGRGESLAVESAALAYYMNRTGKRDPGRKMRVL